MLECNGILTLFAHNICLHAYIHFICLIQIQNTEIYRLLYTANQPKNTEIWIFAHIAQP